MSLLCIIMEVPRPLPWRKGMRARLLCIGSACGRCALGLAAAPGAAQINIGITVGTPPPPHLVIPVPPQLVVIPADAWSSMRQLPLITTSSTAGSITSPMREHGLWHPPTKAPGPLVAVERVPKPLLRVPVAYYKVLHGHGRQKEGLPPWKGHGKGHKHKKHKDRR